MSEEEKPQEIVIVLRKSSFEPGTIAACVSADGQGLFVEEAPNEAQALEAVRQRFVSRNLGVNRSWKTEKKT
jgi:hypothetical protein